MMALHLSGIKINYDQEADILYISFGKSDHVTGVELADNILLRLDTGKASGTPPKAIGLTFVSFSRMVVLHQDNPLNVPSANLRGLPEDLWQAVLAVTTTSPVSDFLAVGLSFLQELVQDEEEAWIMDVVTKVRAYRQAHPDEVMTFDSPEAVNDGLA